MQEEAGEIDSSDLRERTKIIMRNLGVDTIEKMTNLTKEQITGAPNAGQETLLDVMCFLAKHNLKLRKSVDLKVLPNG
jgi:DNA-directed RNA polymerase alpha subunit